MRLYDKVLIAGLVVGFIGVAMAWTDRGLGLLHVLFPDHYESVGSWLIRIGGGLAFLGALAHVAIQLT